MTADGESGVSAEILRRIANVRGELNELEALLRAMPGANKAQARVLADLCDRTNDLTNEIKAGEEAK
jgi:hypothetical protein